MLFWNQRDTHSHRSLLISLSGEKCKFAVRVYSNLVFTAFLLQLVFSTKWCMSVEVVECPWLCVAFKCADHKTPAKNIIALSPLKILAESFTCENHIPRALLFHRVHTSHESKCHCRLWPRRKHKAPNLHTRKRSFRIVASRFANPRLVEQ